MAGTLIVDLIGIPKSFYFQSADPAVANPSHLRTGIHWIDTSSSPYVWKRRNSDNDGWDTLSKVRTDAEFNTDVDGRITAANLATDAELATAIADHEAAANPHPTYLTQAEGDGLYEPLGSTAGTGDIDDDAVTNAKLANMAQSTIKGRATGAGTGDPVDLTAAQATAILDAVVGDSGAGGTKGLVPAPGAGDAAAGKFLKADGSFAVPSGGAPGGSAGGDLAGTYPNPRVAQVNDANGNELLKFGTTASAVNEVTITNKATGTGPTVEATGGDTNIDLNLKSKGTGQVQQNGVEIGYMGIPQNSQAAAYTTVLADKGKHIFHPSSDANARTFTIDSNANVAYPIGTAITFINMTSQVVTIAITSDTLRLAGAGTTGSRSLAQYGVATAIKIDTTLWIISGTGLT